MIEHNFTYNVPDMFGTVTTEKNLTESATYKGPEFFYVTLDENNKIYTPDDILVKNELLNDGLIDCWRDGKNYKLIDAKEQPLVAYLLAQMPEKFEKDSEDVLPEQQHYYLEGEEDPFFSHSLPILIEEIYNPDNIIYDEENDTFDVPMMDHSKPESDDDFFTSRDKIIAEVTSQIRSGEYTKDEVVALKAYIDGFTDLEIKYADYPQHMWPRPDYPLDDNDGPEPEPELEPDNSEPPTEEEE